MRAWLRRQRLPTARTSAPVTRRTRLSLEPMEGRDVPAVLGDPTIAIASYNGATDATAQLLDTTNDSTRVRVAPFAGFRGELSVSAGDVNGDGVADAIVGAQAPDGHVKVFDGTSGALLQSFFAFAGFNGAVNVGSADVNGDGFADVLVTAGAINGHVKAFSGQNGAPVSSFFAFPGFYGQTSISGADFDHDGRAEIIVGAGAPGVGGHVALFHGDGSVFNPGVFAFPGFGGTVSVASGDVNGDGTPDIVVGAGRGAPGGQVKVFSGTDFSVIGSFLPYAPGVTNGVNVQLADPNQDGGLDIIVTMQGGGFPSVSKFAGTSGYRLALLLSDPDTSDADYTAYYDSSWYTTPDTSYTPPDTSYYYDPGPSYDPWWSYDPWSGYYDPGPSYTPPDTSYTPPDTSYSDPWYYDPGPSYDPGYTSPDYGGGGDFDSDDYGGGGDF